MRTFIVLCLLGMVAPPARSAEPVWRAQVELDDGSRLVGTVKTAELRFDVAGRATVIEVSDIVSARIDREKWTVVTESGRSLTGRMLTKSVGVETLLGPLDIPLARATGLEVYPEGAEVSLPARDDLVLYMPFDRNARDKTRNVAGPLHHGEVRGAKWVPNGKRRGAFEFDGTNGIEIPHHAELCPQAFTVAAWIRANDPAGNWRLIVSKTNNSSWNGGYAICRYYDDNRKVYFYAGSYGAPPAIPEEIPQHEWVHVAGTFDGDELRMYVNGEPSLPTKLSDQRQMMTHVTTPLHIGSGGGYNWIGTIDEVVLYKRALTIQEIEKLMAAADPKK